MSPLPMRLSGGSIGGPSGVGTLVTVTAQETSHNEKEAQDPAGGRPVESPTRPEPFGHRQPRSDDD